MENPEEEVDELCNLFEQGDAALRLAQETKSEENWRNACQQAGRMLAFELPDELHWFCDTEWVPFAGMALMLNSASPAREVIYSLVPSLFRYCPECACIYHEMKLYMAEFLPKDVGIPEDRVKAAVVGHRRNDISRLGPRLKQAVAKLDAKNTNSSAEKVGDYSETWVAFVECFYLAPLVDDEEFLKIVETILPYLQALLDTKYGRKFADTAGRNELPGIFSLFFGTHAPVIKDWLFRHFLLPQPDKPKINLTDDSHWSKLARTIFWRHLSGLVVADTDKVPELTLYMDLAAILSCLDDESVSYLLQDSAERSDSSPKLQGISDCDIVGLVLQPLKILASDIATDQLYMAYSMLHFLGAIPQQAVTAYFEKHLSEGVSFASDAMTSLLIWNFPVTSIYVGPKNLGRNPASYTISFGSVTKVIMSICGIKDTSTTIFPNSSSRLSIITIALSLTQIQKDQERLQQLLLLGVTTLASSFLVDELLVESSEPNPHMEKKIKPCLSKYFGLASTRSSLLAKCCFGYNDTDMKIQAPALRILQNSVLWEIARDVNILVKSKSTENLEIPQEIFTEPSLWRAVNSYTESKSPTPVIAAVLRASKQGALLSYHSKGIQCPSTPSLTNMASTLKKCSALTETEARSLFGDDHPDIMRNAILLTFLSDEEVSQLADDLLTQAFEPMAIGRIECISSMIRYNPNLILDALVNALDIVMEQKDFSPCPGVVKVIQDYLDAMYDSGSGVITPELKSRMTPGLSNGLLRFWNTVWQFLKFTLDNTKRWSQYYHNTLMLEFVKDQMHFGHDLLENFRLFEDDLGDLLKWVENAHCGELLAQPVVNCIESMCVLLKLRDLKLIESSLENILAILSLMKSFKVAIPKTLIAMFCNYSNQSIKNNLSLEQCRTLLNAIGSLSVDRIDALVEQGYQRRLYPTRQEDKTGGAVRQAPATKLPTGSTVARTTSEAAPTRQRTLADFNVLQRQASAETGEAAPAQLSQIELLRQNLLTSKIHGKPATSSAVPKEIHPPRPPGFNSKKATSAPSNVVTVSSTLVGKRHGDDSNAQVDDSNDESDSDDDDLFNTGKVSITGTASAKSTSVTSAKAALNQKEIDEKNMHARMHISINPFHAQILVWNYHNDSAFPSGDSKGYKAVPDTFGSYEEYRSVYEPLLLLECWQGVRGSKEEKKGTPFSIDVGRRVRCDEFYDIYATMHINEFNREKLSDSDLILLTCYGVTRTKATYPDASVPNCFAKVTRVSKSKTASGFVDVNLRIHCSITSVLPKLSQGSYCHALKVMSLATVEREYTSLRALEYYELKDRILSANVATPGNNLRLDINRVMATFDTTESQAKAVTSSLNVEGFSLVLGPPGTGKTKTILAILGYALTHFFQRKEKIFICAPSNAAVDELVIRIKGGLKSAEGNPFKPRLVRVGRSEVVHESVQDVTLEEIVDRECSFQNNKSGGTSSNATNSLAERQRLTDILHELYSKRTSLAGEITSENMAKLEDEIRATMQALKEVRHKVDIERAEQLKDHRNQDITRRQVQERVLRDAQIICTTLSGAAHSVLSSLQMRFDMVIIDEAAQSIELSSLIPLKYGCRSCVLVGDPKQLPPTVLSQEATKMNYEKSLFVRMFNKSKDKVNLLNVQFRMHPAIASFPSHAFYDGKLFTSPTVVDSASRPWHHYLEFAPYRFFDCVGTDTPTSNSFTNIQEAEVILNLYQRLLDLQSAKSKPASIGIISPYRAQVTVIRNFFQREFGSGILSAIDFNTVDAFQGQEKDIIIFSCVRADTTRGIGFLNDQRRLNVAITRAKCSMWIVGHSQHLSRSSRIWDSLISDAKDRDMFSNAHKGFLNNPARALVRVNRVIEVEEPSLKDNKFIYDIPITRVGLKNVPNVDEFPRSNRWGLPVTTLLDNAPSSDIISRRPARTSYQIEAEGARGRATGSPAPAPAPADNGLSARIASPSRQLTPKQESGDAQDLFPSKSGDLAERITFVPREREKRRFSDPENGNETGRPQKISNKRHSSSGETSRPAPPLTGGSSRPSSKSPDSTQVSSPSNALTELAARIDHRPSRAAPPWRKAEAPLFNPRFSKPRQRPKRS